MYSFKDKRLSLVILILTFLLCPTVTGADGLLIPHEKEDIYQPSQKAVILFDNNTEQLIIQSKYEGNITDFGWIIPLPSDPKVEIASEQLFLALHEITYPENYDTNEFFNVMNETRKVEILDKVDIGPYNIVILSAKEPDSLTEWLKENNYNFPRTKNDRETLEYYINKKWFFVAIKVDVVRNKNEIINKYRNIDERISSTDDIVMYLSEDLLEDIKEEKTYEDSTFKKLNIENSIYNNYIEMYWQDCSINLSIHNFVVNEISGYRSSEKVLINYKSAGYDAENISQLESMLEDSIFRDLSNNQSYKDSRFKVISLKENETEKIRKYNELNDQYLEYLNRDYKIKSQLAIDISNIVDPEIHSIENKLKSGTIEPIKMTFDTNEIIYPLKISSLGDHKMEILIYTLTDSKTQAKNFSLEYGDWIYPNIANTTSLTSSFWSLENIINKKYFLTKLRANLTVDQMTQDVIISRAEDNNPYRMKIENHQIKTWKVLLNEILQSFIKVLSLSSFQK